MTDIVCKVSKIEALTPFVQRIILTPEKPVSFKAGQYIRVAMSETDRRPFSIANGPQDNDFIELHIGATEQNPYAWEVLKHLEAQDKCIIDGPHGNAFWRQDSDKPIILLAGGTGYSYTSSLLNAMLATPGKQPLFLYWGTRTEEDMYHLAELQALAAKHSRFNFVPVIETPSENWSGKSGLVHEAIMQDFTSLEPYQVYVAGRFEMAGKAREDFSEKGLVKEHLFGDAFEFI